MHFSSSKENIYVYVEKYSATKKSVIIDFSDSFDFSAFLPIINLEDIDIFEKPSMIEVLNYDLKQFENRSRILEGTTYVLNEKTIEEILEKEQIITIDDSFVLGFQIDMEGISEDLFGGTMPKSKDPFSPNFSDSDQKEDEPGFIPLRMPSLGNKNVIIIRKVGQGNWNEIISDGKTILCYDFGTSIRAKRSAVEKIIASRYDIIKNQNPGLIISHWDLDHYHCLLGLDDETLQSFSFILVRDHLPNLTVRLIQGRIRNLPSYEGYFPIPAFPRPDKKPKGYITPLKLMENISGPQIKIFNAEYHRDRNKSGIVVVIQSAKSTAIFSADHDYNQINTSILKDLNPKLDHYLVVPHHGGKAGKFVYEISPKIRMRKAIISVGKNNYGHPDYKIKEKLLELKFKIDITNMRNEDIEIEV